MSTGPDSARPEGPAAAQVSGLVHRYGDKLALDDIAGLRQRPRRGERPVTLGAGEEIEQSPLQTGRYREAQSWKASSV